MAEKRKRIALFVGQADEGYQSNIISGFLERAFEYDLDACVFSMYRKYQDTAERELGESNIFALMRPEDYDGAVILEDSIQTAGAAKGLEERLHEQFGDKPVLVVEQDSPYFPYVFTDGYNAMVELVDHLIEVHGYKDIAFLAGKRWHKHSITRANAYRASMEAHGLEPREDRTIYGDFWYSSGEVCADQLMGKGRELPQAVVCANDAMAIGLCKAFEKRGVRVPEDVAVVSYDSTYEGQTSPKPITSSLVPAVELGHYAADYIHNSLSGKQTPPFEHKPKLVIGQTCGCTEMTIPQYSANREKWGTEISEEGYDSVFNSIAENLMAQTDLQEFLSVIYSYAYQISDAQSFYLCLCPLWEHMGADAGIHVKNTGYPDRMICAVRYNSDRKDGIVGLDTVFDTRELLPGLFEKSDHPQACFFTPLFFANECYGYAAVNYGGKARSYDDVYRRWIATVSRGFEALRCRMISNNLQDKLDKMRSSKFAGGAAYESLSEEEKKDYDLVGKILDDNLLTYYFQPIVKVSDASIYSYEALMRSNTLKRISPLDMIKYANMQSRLSDIETATFLNVLEIISKSRDIIGKAKVFINSIPGVPVNSVEYQRIEEYLGKNSDVVVVELTEEAELDDEQLKKQKDFFTRLHLEIAVDDYGTGYSNVNNLLRYMPNYVKIDRALLSEIDTKPQKQHFVREIIGFCHDNNIMALAEGVETVEELRTVIHLGADLIQGYYTAKPSANLIPQIDEKVRGEIKSFYQERLDGSTKQIYVAGKTNRISLVSLSKDGCTDIVVGRGTMVYKDFSIFGTPGAKTNIHVIVEPGYIGRIDLESAYFSNVKNRPCIELSSGCDVTLSIEGDNILNNGGILVPKDSRLTIEGGGNLKISVNSADYSGIGGHTDQQHGEIVFEQDGIVDISCRGVCGTCIGSGLGGIIKINRGQYELKATGENGVAIGTTSGESELDITTCNISIELATVHGAGIGSQSGKCRVNIAKSSVSISGTGTDVVAVGTVTGEQAQVHLSDSMLDINMSADRTTALGALNAGSMVKAKDASLRIEMAGEKSLVFGGYSEQTDVELLGTDTRAVVHNSCGRDTYAKDENVRIVNGRRKIVVNDKEIQRELVFDYKQ
ncbi:EAL domain-containing protein [Ruminococcus sp. FC2018]|uniref:EAL domain-containing protein n=1 Tax=Ruminococcus sp. FC2018 TaxID=1410617 RepID=UPI000688162D|nr:EAL domain-containing protein [Ruminococcus sp. FC2018]